MRRALLIAAWLTAVAVQAEAQRRVTFRADDGVVLAAAFYEPSHAAAPGIILLHMLGRSHSDWDAAATQLAAAGFAVLALDFRGDDPRRLSADVKAAKAFLRGRSDVDQGRLGVAGASVGANLAIADAADDPAVRSVALLSPGIDYKGVRTEAAMRKYGNRPALLVASSKDPYARRSVRHLTTLGSGTREVRLSDAVAHGTTLLSRDPDLVAALVDWFRRTL